MLLRKGLKRCQILPRILQKNFSHEVQDVKASSISSKLKTFQFSKEKLVDFGELPRGEIPDALKVNPKFDHVVLENNAQIGLEHYAGCHTGLLFIFFI